MEKKLAFLGPRGTFTEEAARTLTQRQPLSLVPYPSIIDVLDAVSNKEVAFGVVPMENSIEGTVNSTLDWLIHEVDLPILAELALPITQNLLVAKREQALPLSAITKVLSHPQAIAQSHNFLRENLPHAKIEYMNSTALAAKTVSEHPEEPWAAVGTKLNVEIYPLEFAREQIQDYSNNYTRFVLVGTEPLELQASSREKTTILVTLPEDFPGALYQVLAAFAWRKVNLSRIESRPTKKALGSYYFVIDIEQKMDDVLLPGAFAEIEAIGCQVRQLGTYPFYMQGAKLEANL
ncbi:MULTISPECIES: prephenate dehydratase [Brevibacillus]|jgi:prephenate dehydratase|uniref:prephenate dehydratase n=1 Tax=Brevibacillus TaxID=55080 RepID=UPI00156ACB6B|nr:MULTISPECIES: prephenate dehydratase [Brevibacillus]MBU8714809.1 prephenate dehydratase [Brevibacillus parabrevis]MDH6348772.1 prephenate dehydratase [Brevibacillus sp. 1238]MDR5000667.1 prephenate dehydratase [Brevibacillus parabrevis]MED2253227.1 prephenate dehydratase [Brevibacillus parabrevis]NRQ55586.1 prephenate dehydratase [Brevibacillus sp. HD1.4A]